MSHGSFSLFMMPNNPKTVADVFCTGFAPRLVYRLAAGKISATRDREPCVGLAYTQS